MDKNVILIVDDDKDIRESLQEILEDEGYRIFTASNGKEAFEFLSTPAAQQPSLILLDLMMPVMGGSEFIVQKKTQPELSHIPTVIMSASNLSPQSVSALDATDHIRKPFDFEGLLSTVKRYCH